MQLTGLVAISGTSETQKENWEKLPLWIGLHSVALLVILLDHQMSAYIEE